MRVTLDRDGPLYHAIYNQRTNTERINSQSKELGIKRPKVRNLDSVRNLNTLTYLVINARALRRARQRNADLLRMPVKLIALPCASREDDNSSSATSWPGLFRLPAFRRNPTYGHAKGVHMSLRGWTRGHFTKKRAHMRAGKKGIRGTAGISLNTALTTSIPLPEYFRPSTETPSRFPRGGEDCVETVMTGFNLNRDPKPLPT